MCGRVYLTDKDDVLRFLQDVFDVHGREALQLELHLGERFPANELLVLRECDGEPDALTVRWGVQPAWSNRPLINVKQETAHAKSTWSRAFRERRCVLPVSSFYGWDGRELNPRSRYKFHLEDSDKKGARHLWLAALDG